MLQCCAMGLIFHSDPQCSALLPLDTNTLISSSRSHKPQSSSIRQAISLNGTSLPMSNESGLNGLKNQKLQR